MYQTLMVAVDLSDEAMQLWRRGRALADAFGADLCVLHVVEPVLLEGIGDVMVPNTVDLEQQMVDLAQNQLAEIAQKVGELETPRRVELGATGLEIQRVIEEEGADLLIVGRHGRHGLALFMGTTTDAVLHRAGCDVLAVRLPADAKAPSSEPTRPAV